MNISSEIEERIICPETNERLLEVEGRFCNSINKSISYPIIDNIPILISNNKSIFSVEDFQKKLDTTWELKPNRIFSLIKKLSPSIGLNIKAKKNYKNISKILPKNAKILVVGGSIPGKGMEAIYDEPSFETIGMDVSYGSHTKIIADGHNIPFMDKTFDCVVVQAVLEHVLDPKRCVEEIYRVLKQSAVVYAETPFMQQVHMKQYDFTRFTHLGHRRLFKNFEEIEHAPLMGPGTVLAWSYTHFIKSFSSSKKIVFFLTAFANLTSFFLKYFDYYLIDKPGSYDSASAFYFLGKKTNKTLKDRDLIKGFKGMM